VIDLSYLDYTCPHHAEIVAHQRLRHLKRRRAHAHTYWSKRSLDQQIAEAQQFLQALKTKHDRQIHAGLFDLEPHLQEA
jgi:hypothetical protein